MNTEKEEKIKNSSQFTILNILNVQSFNNESLLFQLLEFVIVI